MHIKEIRPNYSVSETTRLDTPLLFLLGLCHNVVGGVLGNMQHSASLQLLKHTLDKLRCVRVKITYKLNISNGTGRSHLEI